MELTSHKLLTKFEVDFLFLKFKYQNAVHKTFNCHAFELVSDCLILFKKLLRVPIKVFSSNLAPIPIPDAVSILYFQVTAFSKMKDIGIILSFFGHFKVHRLTLCLLKV